MNKSLVNFSDELSKRLNKNFVGFPDFDWFFDGLDTNRSFLPHNVVHLSHRETGEEKYAIELAVAGYTKEDITIELEDSVLTVHGNKRPRFVSLNDTLQDSETNEDPEWRCSYRHKGLAYRSFYQRFNLPRETEIEKAELKDGILVIFVKVVKPESHKRVITIDTVD